ncbi:hypothetical protein LEN26_001166 [Aphanomyces euteiches]|nr:hypothetical protein AeMF1_002499 [Aphanomyces euteiches]KAH9161965.1 hypothetical protein LEN26_001166 [Aphanomyces euteiches]KAH9190819.1 hypothetical protein AeNC1_007207 [Aphanomyces euteiches]
MGCAHSTPATNANLFTNWTATEADNASPCPFLNAIANHGLVPRTGITFDKLKEALANLQLDERLQKVLTGSIAQELATEVDGVKQLSLSQLSAHNAIEHDASLTRQDAALGDSVKLDPELLSALVALSSDGQYLTKAHLGHYRSIREQHSKTHNSSYTFDSKQQAFAYLEAALLLLILRDSTGNIRIDWLKMVFEQEKLPIELGWELRSITTEEVLVAMGDLKGEKFEETILEQLY